MDCAELKFLLSRNGHRYILDSGDEAITVSDHFSIQDVDRYRSRSMPVPELLAMNDHLAVCLMCRELFEEPDRLRATYTFVRASLGETGVGAGPHLNYDQIVSYTEELLSDQERNIVNIHLEACRSCEAEVDDLQRTRAVDFSERPETGGRSSRSFRGRPRSALSSGYGIPLQIALTFAIAAVASVITAYLLQGRLGQQEALLNEVRARGDELQRGLEESKGSVAELKREIERIGELSSGDPSAVRIAVNDAQGSVTLNAKGTIGGLEFVEPRDERLIRESLTTGKAPTPAMLTKLLGKPGTTMGPSNDSFGLLSPVGTVILTNHPTLRWELLSGASGYLVTVLDSGFGEVETSPMLSETEWQVTRPLRPGGVYLWQVRALKDGVEIRSPSTKQGEAKFKVLERSKALEVERLKHAYSNSHLALGVLYANSGLLEEANREFEALARANPESKLVKSLIRSLKHRTAK